MPLKDKAANNAYFREYYQKHKKLYFDRATRRQAANRKWFEERFKDILHCSKCLENHRACLDFHHINPSEKENKIADMIRICSKKKIETEVAKCIVLCANCHRKLHAK